MDRCVCTPPGVGVCAPATWACVLHTHTHHLLATTSPRCAALGIPHTWITENALIALHVWILHNRFKVDYNVAGDFNGRRMQEQLFERLWEDTTLRIRNAGVRTAARCRNAVAA